MGNVGSKRKYNVNEGAANKEEAVVAVDNSVKPVELDQKTNGGVGESGTNGHTDVEVEVVNGNGTAAKNGGNKKAKSPIKFKLPKGFSSFRSSPKSPPTEDDKVVEVKTEEPANENAEIAKDEKKDETPEAPKEEACSIRT
uniref:Uncharacterized protein n=1 Tax=Ciona savignyi TaxID=51511 RepID=H2ZAG1_CIOSA